MYYILEGREPVLCDNMDQWSKWSVIGNRRVAETVEDEVRVSTVFLGLDHSYDKGKPVLFETMIFGGDHDEDMRRYSTYEEAEAGHLEACKLAGLDPTKG